MAISLLFSKVSWCYFFSSSRPHSIIMSTNVNHSTNWLFDVYFWITWFRVVSIPSFFWLFFFIVILIIIIIEIFLNTGYFPFVEKHKNNKDQQTYQQMLYFRILFHIRKCACVLRENCDEHRFFFFFATSHQHRCDMLSTVLITCTLCLSSLSQ